MKEDVSLAHANVQLELDGSNLVFHQVKLEGALSDVEGAEEVNLRGSPASMQVFSA